MNHFSNGLIFCSVIFLTCFGCMGCEGKAQTDKPVDQSDTTVTKEAACPFTDMVLCYGGSRHRTPYLWDKDRFSPYVTYTDESGKEHWLFDAFLCIEFQSTNRTDGKKYSYCTGNLQGIGQSAGKAQWEELLDYWFADDSGLEALDQTVGEAAERLGQPLTKRQVVMVLPDPILHLYYDDVSSSTVYWGELNGKQMDFSITADRVAVYNWFVDQIMDRFEKAGYKNIELAGFYKVSEDMTTPTDGWCYDMKKLDVVIPSVAKYVHSLNKKIYWIPYRAAAGYKLGSKFGFDYVWMQPNFYWHGDEYPMDDTFRMITDANIGMEFEMDSYLLEGGKDCDLYKMRFRKYMEYCKMYGLYGKTPFTYYIGQNGLYQLAKSSAESDQKLYNEFCKFIIEDPLRPENN